MKPIYINYFIEYNEGSFEVTFEIDDSYNNYIVVKNESPLSTFRTDALDKEVEWLTTDQAKEWAEEAQKIIKYKNYLL